MQTPSPTTNPDEWVEIAECRKYKINRKAEIIEPPGKILKPTLMQIGYHSIILSKGPGKQHRRYIHRLVAETFIGTIPQGSIVNHIDGDKLNNHLENLEIVDGKENGSHWVAIGGRIKGQPGAKSRSTSICSRCGGDLSYHPSGGGYCKPCSREEKRHSVNFCKGAGKIARNYLTVECASFDS